jgi:hypothetical protein
MAEMFAGLQIPEWVNTHIPASNSLEWISPGVVKPQFNILSYSPIRRCTRCEKLEGASSMLPGTQGQQPGTAIAALARI